MDENTAVLRARRFLQQHGVQSAPVDVMALAAAEGFEVKLRDLPEGEAGSTLTRGDRRIILVNERDPLVRQRFTILHEIAHHMLDLPSVHGQAPALVDDGLAKPGKRPPEEVACDAFASECLVPHAQLSALIAELPFTIASLEALGVRFEASQHCIASQWIKASDEQLAFVVATERRIEWAFPSRRTREARLRIENGRMLPTDSAADRLVREASGERGQSELDATDWSLSDAAEDFVAYEDASHFAPLHRTYSCITFEQASNSQPDRVHQAADEDDALLPALTGELQWKPRR